jgi:hypothetical protein
MTSEHEGGEGIAVRGTIVKSQADLDSEGDLLGAEFGLGPRTGAWLVKRMPPRSVLGLIILIVVVFGCIELPFILPGLASAISAVVVCDLVVLAVALMTVPPRFRVSRLYLYEGGIAVQLARDPEPAVLRWADLDSLVLTVRSGYEGDFIAACVPRERDGREITVDYTFASGIAEIVPAAERLLAPRVVPGLLARYDAGEPVTVGRVTVSPDGIEYASEPSTAPEWRIAWAEARSVDLRMHGHRITVERIGGRARRAAVDGVPDGFAVRYLIEHAAGRAGVAVTADAAAWDGEMAADAVETARDTAGTPAPLTPAAPGAAPVPGAAPALAPVPVPAATSARRRLPFILLAAVVILAAEGAVIGYLYASQPPPLAAVRSISGQ